LVCYMIAVLAFIAWAVTYCPADWQFISLEFFGFALLLWTAVRNDAAVIFGSLALTVAAVVVAWMTYTGVHGFRMRDLIAFALLLIQQQLSKKLLSRELAAPELQNPAIAIGIVTLWRWVSLWSEYHFGPASLTIAWSLLGLVVFVIGVIWNEPMYCRMSWLLVVMAILHAAVVDLHQAGLLRTSLNLAAVGIVMLITVGFRSRSRTS
jgi:hypothetical protein